MNTDAVGGRRFILAMMSLLIASILVACKALDSGSYTAIILGTVAAYIGGNTFEAHSQIRAEVDKALGASQGAAPP